MERSGRLILLSALSWLAAVSSFHAAAPLCGHAPCSPRTRRLLLAADEVDVDQAAAAEAATAAFLRKRAAEGDEAFADSMWSVLMQMSEGGSTIFTVQLLDDFSCRFSDTEEYGSWECKRNWVVIEKPRGFFGLTLLLTAKLEAATAERPKWRLVEGLVQSANATDPSAADGDSPMELREIGTFGANEYEEALLTDLNRFQGDGVEGEEAT